MIPRSMTLISTGWLLICATAVALAGAAMVTRIGARRAATLRLVAAAAAEAPAGNPSSDVERLSGNEAELELCLLYRRLRAYLRDGYDVERSRIKDQAGFEACLDRAVALNVRIAQVHGAEIPADEEARSEVRAQLLAGLRRGAMGRPRPVTPAAQSRTSHSW
jgi:hypothetical protein